MWILPLEDNEVQSNPIFNLACDYYQPSGALAVGHFRTNSLLCTEITKYCLSVCVLSIYWKTDKVTTNAGIHIGIVLSI